MNSSRIIRTDDLREQNRLRILETLRIHDALTRAEIAEKTGLSPATLSTQFSWLEEQGIVSSKNYADSDKSNTANEKRGRPKVTASLNPQAALSVTVALTLNCITFCLLDYSAKELNRNTVNVDLHTLDQSQLIELTIKGINELIPADAIDKLKTISVAFQGATNTNKGELIWSIILSEKNIPIAAALESNFGLPVTVNNDCALIAKAIHNQHQDKVTDNFAAVLFSHGIGLGVYLDGKPFGGAHSSGFELGHIQYEPDGRLCRCGRRGCIEAYASSYGMLQTAHDLQEADFQNHAVNEQEVELLIEAAHKNEPNALKAFEVAGKAVGHGLATVFTLLDPLPLALIVSNNKMLDLVRDDIHNTLLTAQQASNLKDHDYVSFDDNQTLMHHGLALVAMSTLDTEFSQTTLSKQSKSA